MENGSERKPQEVIVGRRFRLAQKVEDLSRRERQVMELTSAGKTDSEIGIILGISPRTARFHVENIKIKLDSSTRVQAVAKYIRMKVVAELRAEADELEKLTKL